MWTIKESIHPENPAVESTFTVAEVGTFTYEQLLSDRDGCLDLCRKTQGGSEEDFDNLRIKMNDFINNVTKKYIGG